MKSRLDTRQLMLLESEVKNQGKNMVIAYILWYFLGILGGHRFYMNKTSSAIAMLILCITIIGLFPVIIWWIVDAFLLHTWVKEHNRKLEYHLVSHMLSHQAPPAPNTF